MTTGHDPHAVPEDQQCRCCPHWKRVAHVGNCIHEGTRQGWLTSGAYGCPDHPKFKKPEAE